MNSSERKVKEIFALAGIEINGNRPYDPKINNQDFYKRFLSEGRLALGESYMDGWWDCERMDEMFCKLYGALVLIKNNLKTPSAMLIILREKLLPYGSQKRSRNIGKHHYDIGNELYKRMLDPYMVYSCALWENGAENLAQAQQHKLQRICEKLKIESGHHILEIGCGWGSFARYATENYQDIKVTGLSVSQEQIKLGLELCKNLPVELLYKDYREHQGHYPRIASIAMFEAVGKKYFRDYFKKVHGLLDKEGIFFLHTIGFNTSDYASPWIQKYIFPGAYLPSMTQLSKASEGLFVIEHVENIGPNYGPTLNAWYDNFIANWEEIKALNPEKYDERFKRMWIYYLLQCSATFTARIVPLWQLVMRKPEASGSYFFKG